MNSFTQFYLLEDVQPITLDWFKGVRKGTEINKAMYDYAKGYLGREIFKNTGFKINDKLFKLVNVTTGDPKLSKIIDKGLLGHSWDTVKEIIKYTLNYGEVYLVIVSQGSNDYYFIGNDIKFFENSKSSIYRILDFLRPKQQAKSQEIRAKAQSKEQVAQDKEIEKVKTAEEQKKIKEQQKTLSKSIASSLGLEEVGLFNFKNEMLGITFEAKSVQEAQKKIKDATSKLPDTDPRHGKYGYFDMSFEDFDMLTGPKGKFRTNKNWKVKSELGWQTNTRTSEDKEFGIGLMYPLKVTAPKKIEGVVYIFKYNEKYLPNSAILIFEGINSLEAFNQLRILGENDVIGLDKKIRISKASHLRWVDEDPKNIAPPLTAKTVSQIDSIINKPEISTKTKYITPKNKK